MSLITKIREERVSARARRIYRIRSVADRIMCEPDAPPPALRQPSFSTSANLQDLSAPRGTGHPQDPRRRGGEGAVDDRCRFPRQGNLRRSSPDPTTGRGRGRRPAAVWRGSDWEQQGELGVGMEFVLSSRKSTRRRAQRQNQERSAPAPQRNSRGSIVRRADADLAIHPCSGALSR